MGTKQIRVCDTCGTQIEKQTGYKISKVIMQTEKFKDLSWLDVNKIELEFCFSCANDLLNSLKLILNRK
jgi:hypothetical protein